MEMISASFQLGLSVIVLAFVLLRRRGAAATDYTLSGLDVLEDRLDRLEKNVRSTAAASGGVSGEAKTQNGANNGPVLAIIPAERSDAFWLALRDLVLFVLCVINIAFAADVLLVPALDRINAQFAG